MLRRNFLANILKAVSFLTLLPGCLFRKSIFTLNKSHIQTLSSVQDHLLPTYPNSPGAKQVNASRYLISTISDSRDFKLLASGIKDINNLSHKIGKNRFEMLSFNDKEKVLLNMSLDPSGRSWLEFILNYTLEALLSDPIYGGNTDQSGWRWLNHSPGFPRPDIGTRYYELINLKA